MANQLNYSTPIVSTLNVRPDRLASSDTELVQLGTKPSWFGTSDKDFVEIWVYDTNGVIVNQLTLFVPDAVLQTTTVVDNTGSYEYVTIDMGECIRRMVLDQGRYVIAINFFQCEIGNPAEHTLYIDSISPDRTEIKLKLIDNASSKDLFEWIVPSVSKLEAKGLMDLVFGKTEDTSSVITSQKINSETDPNIVLRINNIKELNDYNVAVDSLLERTYTRALELMAQDTDNRNIQDIDFDRYIKMAAAEYVVEYTNSNIFDPRLKIT